MVKTKSTLVIKNPSGEKEIFKVPVVFLAKGNVPTKEEYDLLVVEFNKLVGVLKDKGIIN